MCGSVREVCVGGVCLGGVCGRRVFVLGLNILIKNIIIGCKSSVRRKCVWEMCDCCRVEHFDLMSFSAVK